MSSTAGAIERTRDADGGIAIQRQLVAISLWVVLALLVGLAALLFVRRISGAFHQPLSGAAIVTIAVIVELAGFGWRRLATGTQYASTQYLAPSTQYTVSRLLLVGLLPTLSSFTLLAALTIPGISLWGLIPAWLIVVAGEAAQWRYWLRPEFDRFPFRRSTSDSPASSLAVNEEETEAEIPPGLIQQVTRVFEDDHESIHALVKAHVAANDRLAVMHLAFCPPLTERPKLTAHALDMDEADVRITQAETFGTRIEARLTTVAATERGFLIEILGSVTAAKSA